MVYIVVMCANCDYCKLTSSTNIFFIFSCKKQKAIIKKHLTLVDIIVNT